MDEGIELREAGIVAPILILGYTPPEDIPVALEHDLTLTIFSEECLEAVRQSCLAAKTACKDSCES